LWWSLVASAEFGKQLWLILQAIKANKGNHMLWLIAIAVVAIIVAPVLLDPRHKRRRNANNADNLIAQAGSEYLRGLNDEAFMHFKQARDIARANSVYMLEAEGNYGMARIYERRRDYKSAADCLRSILATRTHWEQYNPNYAALVETYLNEIEAKLSP
jgi:tetratricopeptide (TPR) repeat protein